MKTIFYILFFVFVYLKLTSQNFETEMKMVYANYNQSDKVAFNIDYKLRENHNPNSRIITTSTGKYVKVNDRFISVYDYKLTLVSPTEIIMVDKSEKKIRIKKLKSKIESNPDFMAQLKSYNSFVAKVVPIRTNMENIIMYNVELKVGTPFPISKYELYIDVKKHLITQMSLFYKKPLEKDEDYNIAGTEVPRLDIVFYDINNNKLFTKAELEDAYYYKVRNEKLVPSINFITYDIKEIL